METTTPESKPKLPGWYIFFLGTSALGAIVSVVNISHDVLTIDYSDACALCSDLFTAIAIGAIFIYALIAGLQRKPNAVYLARTYIILIFLQSLLLLWAGDYEQDGYLGSLKQISRSLIWAVVWFLYFIFSKGMKEAFPVSSRRFLTYDIPLVSSLFLLPYIFLAISLYNVYSKATEDAFQPPFANVELQQGQLSDGWSLLQIPEGCEGELVSDSLAQHYYINRDTISDATVTICLAETFSSAEFEEAWQNWITEGYEPEEYSTSSVDSVSYGRNHGWQKRTIFPDDRLESVFTIVFDQQASLCAIVNEWLTLDASSFTEELLYSLEFPSYE